MSADPVARVRAVGTLEEHRVSYDSSTGEICPNCETVRRDVESLEAELRIKRRKIKELQADRERQAEHHELWEPAQFLYHHWQVVCNRRKSPWTTDRFWLIEPFLRQKKHGIVVCRQAIDGAAWESWVTELRNGRFEVHNRWEKIFESSGSVEKHANKAPKNWSLAFSVEMEAWPPQRPTVNDAKSFWGIKPPKGWQPPAQQSHTGQVTMLGVVDGAL
jgi:hypothetical protein